MDALIAGTRTLEQILAAHRKGDPMPEIGSVVAQFERLAPEEDDRAETPEAPESDDLLKAAPLPEARLWRITFTPDPALSERGINVNRVRARMGEIGKILEAKPLVDAAGQIRFAFLLSTPEETFELGEGVTVEPVVPEAPQEAAVPGQGTSAHRALIAPNLVRVDLSRLDALMRLIGELVISRAQLDEQLHRLDRLIPAASLRGLQDTSAAIHGQIQDLRRAVMRVRMVAIGEVFGRMRFVVRDLCREYHKEVQVELQGEETEIDKFIVDRLMDPLLHLVRNAVSHGIESAEARLARGKPAQGRLLLRAETAGETVVIAVEDDGRGIDAQAVAQRSGLPVGDTDQLLEAISSPGFTTLNHADRSSGRGVGMGIVRSAVEELSGSLSLETEPGRGTRFTIRLPLTLAIVEALIVGAGGQRFAVPIGSVTEILEVERSAVTRLENNALLPYRDGVLPLVHLDGLFGRAKEEVQRFYVLVGGDAAHPIGVAVHRLFGQREIVVRALSDPLLHRPGFSGATELGNGQPVLIIDLVALFHHEHTGGRNG